MKLPKLWSKGTAKRRSGSLTRRMIVVAAVWIGILLGLGGFTLDRVLISAITRNFDAQLEYVLTALIASAEVGPEGEAFLNRVRASRNAGRVTQIRAEGPWIRSVPAS